MHSRFGKIFNRYNQEFFQMEQICNLFLSDGIFKDGDEQLIRSQTTSQAKLKTFYEVLKGKDISVLDVFFEYLKQEGNTSLADRMKADCDREKELIKAETRLRTASEVSVRPGTLWPSSSQSSTPIPSAKPRSDSVFQPSDNPDEFTFDDQATAVYQAEIQQQQNESEQFITPDENTPENDDEEPKGMKRVSTPSEQLWKLTNAINLENFPGSNRLFNDRNISLLGKLLGNSQLQQPQQQQPTPTPQPKKWSFPGTVAIKRELEKERYCEAKVTEEIAECVDSWLEDIEKHKATPIDCHIFRMLLIGPKGTGKRSVPNVIAKVLNRSDVIYTDIKEPAEAMLPSINQTQNNNRLVVLVTNGIEVSNRDSAFFKSNESVNKAVKDKCYEFSRDLEAHFNDIEQVLNEQKMVKRVIHIVIQDTDNFLEFEDVARWKKMKRKVSQSKMSPNSMILSQFRPHANKVCENGNSFHYDDNDDFVSFQYFFDRFGDLFSDHAVILVRPIQSNNAKLQVIARDLGQELAHIEERSTKRVDRIIQRFLDDNFDVDDQKRQELRKKLFEDLMHWPHRNKPTRDSRDFEDETEMAHRLRVEFFKNYSHLHFDAVQNEKRKYPFIGCLARRSSKYPQIHQQISAMEDDQSDLKLLDHIRKIIEAKRGPFANKCRKTIHDLLQQMLMENTQRLDSCDFLIKLQIVPRSKHNSNDVQLQFEIASERHQKSHRPKHVAPFGLLKHGDEVDHAENQPPRPLSMLLGCVGGNGKMTT